MAVRTPGYSRPHSLGGTPPYSYPPTPFRAPPPFPPPPPPPPPPPDFRRPRVPPPRPYGPPTSAPFVPPPPPPPPPPSPLRDPAMRVRGATRSFYAPYTVPSRGGGISGFGRGRGAGKKLKPAMKKKSLGLPQVNNGEASAIEMETSSEVLSTVDGSTTVDDQTDEDLKVPPEMLQPLFCKLCETKLNGNLQANAHYEGKNHGKKVRQYLEKVRQEKGIKTPLPPVNGKAEKEKSNLEETYCKLCDVAFTSEIQAKQHYNGRNHQRRMRGEPPLPKGFYNPLTGKWQRQPPVGIPFKLPTSQQKKVIQKFTCNICNTSMTSQAQMEAHLSGAKHKSKILLQGRTGAVMTDITVSTIKTE